MEEDSGMPQFGKLNEIISTPSEEFLFVTSKLTTLQYQRHYHAYEVDITSEIYICSYQDLYDFHPLELTVAYGSCRHNMISLKYHLF